MKRHPIEPATRAYAKPVGGTDGVGAPKKGRRARKEREPAFVLVFDTETSTDATQRFHFGVSRVYYKDTLIEEALLYADDLEEADKAALRAYVRDNASDVPTEYGMGHRPLVLYTLSEWEHTVWYRIAYQHRGLVVGFNLPFDLSRIAIAAHEGKQHNRGAWVFTTREYLREGRARRDDKYHPNVVVRSIDSKRALIQFGVPGVPEHERGRKGKAYRGRFLDLRTLAFALTNESHSLASACRAFGALHSKDTVGEHGRITPEYITYARHDVRATYALYEAMGREYAMHGLDLPPWRVMSPASIGKAYLRKVGIATPRIAVAPDVGLSADAVQAACMQAYYGGRAECRIRRTPVPVVYLDFTSMYPTVNALMGQWALLTAEAIGVEEATGEIAAFLTRVSADAMLDPASWKVLPAIVEVLPDDDILPVRYRSHEVSTFNIGVNYLKAAAPMWYTLADVAASILLTGKRPNITRALRFAPIGQQQLRPVRLRGEVAVDPRRDDFFRTVIEERQRIKGRLRDAASEDCAPLDALQTFLKVLANSTSYGIYVEMSRQESSPTAYEVWNGTGAHWRQEVAHPEEPGAYFCPLLAAGITGAARLMLALTERLVRDAGGHYAMMDTDSMAIVATPDGGSVPCEGTPGGTIRALSWSDVEGIRQRFASLNPYDRDAIAGSVLKVEHKSDTREVWCHAVSAKRYALYRYREGGTLSIIKPSEHGLGHALPPYQREEPDSEHQLRPDKVWMADVWAAIIGGAYDDDGNDEADAIPWGDQPVFTRITLSKPDVGRTFAKMNKGKPYAKQIKPFNFLLHAHVVRWHTRGQLNIVAPFDRDVGRWRAMKWVNAYDGTAVSIAAGYETDGIKVQTYRELLDSFAAHPEAKSGTPDGMPCGKETRGLLHRLHLTAIREPLAIGKESNKLEDIQSKMVHTEEEVSTVYQDGDDAAVRVLHALWEALPVGTLAHDVGIAPDKLRAIAMGAAIPRAANRARLHDWLWTWLRDTTMALAITHEAASVLTLAGLFVCYQERIREVREECRATLTALTNREGVRGAARALGMSVSTVQRWACGALPVQPAALLTIRQLLTPTGALP